MKISYNWLKHFVSISESPEELSKILTSTGLEVEGLEKFESIEGGLEGVVIGEVMSCDRHPNADKLSLTTVDTGSEILPIVCGAPNVALGQKVVVATVGTTLYPEGGSFKIKKSKIRGEVSMGMLCAEDELGLGNSHEGIIVLDQEVQKGTLAKDLFNIEEDYIFEIGLTPNRVDAASHLGVARDIAAVLNRPLTINTNSIQPTSTAVDVDILIENNDACPRYAAVCIDNVQVGDSPEWIQKTLTSIGVGSVNNIVDITNYVLHSLGQPLHAFDRDQINGKVRVKTLEEGTPFVLLDKKEIKLSSNDLVICDDQGALCLAGIYGGLHSGVTQTTSKIFLESAYFSPDYIRKSSLRHGLKTDASFRFERGVDPDMTLHALALATQMIIDIAGGEVVSEVKDLYQDPILPSRVNVKYKNIDRLIGKALGKDKIQQILNSLFIEIVEENDKGLTLSVPAYRVDVTREADVIEEILRIYGYDNIELSEHLGSEALATFPEFDENSLMKKAAGTLVGSGFFEIMNSSLTTSKYTSGDEWAKANENVVVLNKLSEDLDVMRQSLVFGGLESIAHNVNRKQKNLKFFEFGYQYHYIDGAYLQSKQLAIFLAGNKHEESWLSPNKPVDFYDLSEIVFKLLRQFGIQKVVQYSTTNNLFQYGLDLIANDETIASLGVVKKEICKKANLDTSVLFCEINWEYLSKTFNGKLTAKEVSKFPEVKRDLSLVIDKKISFSEIQELAFKTERKLLKKLNVFSTYEGDKIDEGKKSYAISFLLHDHDKTLSDKLIDKTMNRLINVFEKELNALIRK